MKNAFVILLMALFAIGNVSAKTPRSTAAKHAFMRANPCPSDKPHSKYTCPGFVVDHIKALDCGGADAPKNMQWQTIAEAKAKDKWERSGAECAHPTAHRE